MIIKCPHCDKEFYFVLKEVANNVFVNPYQDINGPVQIPADDSNYDVVTYETNPLPQEVKDSWQEKPFSWKYEKPDEEWKDRNPTLSGEYLEDNVKRAVQRRNNVIRMRDIDLTDDDWYFGC